MTSEELQVQINQNAARQQETMDDPSLDGREKAARLDWLRKEQARLYGLRNAARRQEQGRGPRERVGVGY